MNENERRREKPPDGSATTDIPNREKLSGTAAVYLNEAGNFDTAGTNSKGASSALDLASDISLLGTQLPLRGASAASEATVRAFDEDRNSSFEEIHRKYEGKILNLIVRMVGNRDDADDLTVETFVNAYRAWGRFRGDARVSTWLHQIAVNNCKNYFKQKDRRREREPVSLDDSIETDGGELSRDVADWRNVPENRLMDQELARQIQNAVEALAPAYRTVLVLAQMDDMSYDEIAQVTGLSVPAVKTRLNRARNMMRRRLEPYYRS
ncbi:MAG: sigma-70 family RNA polymerase sigma factor [Armatimonadota bacterium]